MIKLENWEVVGWEHAIRGMRNPKNSWEKSDSYFTCEHSGVPCHECIDYDGCKRNAVYHIGPNDHELMMKLRNAGTDHRKFMRMIEVYVDITAPLYWWKEFDTYKVGTVANSCSTMHTIADKEFTLDDFSHEKLSNNIGIEIDVPDSDAEPLPFSARTILEFTIDTLNVFRHLHNNAATSESKKLYFDNMIQLLPSSYNQKRTIMLSYEVLANIYINLVRLIDSTSGESSANG